METKEIFMKYSWQQRKTRKYFYSVTFYTVSLYWNVYYNFKYHFETDYQGLSFNATTFYPEKINFFGIQLRQSVEWKQDWVVFMSQPFWVQVEVEGEIEIEVEIRLIWDWDWLEV